MKNKILSIFISVIVFINMIIPVCASAADVKDNNSSVYIGNGYIVYYDVKSSWDNNQNIEIKIKNIGSEPIANWALKYDAHGEISGLWNATAYSSNNTQYVIKNSGYNYEIQPDQEVNFGYRVTGESLEIPKAFEICSQRTDKAENEYIVSMNVTNDWGTGFTGKIKIENLSSEPIEAWRLNFDANFTIEDIWNAKLVSADANSYCIANDVTTTPIAANETKTFGFKALKENGVAAEIYNCTVNGVTISENFETLKFLEAGLALTAFAQYNQEGNTIDIFWNTTVQNGKFEIFESDDNVKYNKITETSDFMFYSYNISEDFSEKYFIVRQITDDGRRVESDPILISNNGNGYSIDFPDSDGDGIPDYFENDIGTDPQKDDTDDDGLTDYEEFYLTGTDPTVYDSVIQGISDADADSDEDGLSSRKELELGTKPFIADTDKDGLTDGDEFNVYGTEPLNDDTDGDGIKDGDEILLGLDPLNPQTFDVPDSEYMFEVNIPSDIESFADVNKDSNPFDVSLEIKAAGNILSNIDARESVYSKIMTNDATLGICPEFIYDEGCKIEEVVIQFKIDDEYAAETDAEKAKGSEFYGLKKYNIFKYFEDTGTLLPVKTEINEENNTLSTTVDSLGSYCVIDMEKFLDSFDLQETEVEEQPAVFRALRSASAVTAKPVKSGGEEAPDESKSYLKETDPVNVFFFIDSRLNNNIDSSNTWKEEILEASMTIFDKSENAKVYLIRCDSASVGNAYKILNGDSEDGSFTNSLDLLNKLEELGNSHIFKRSYSNNCVLSDALSVALKKIDKETASYGFYIFNQENVLFREQNGRDLLSEVIDAGINISIISKIDPDYIDGYALDMYKQTNGIHIKKDSGFSSDILMHMYNTIPDDYDPDSMYMLLAGGLQEQTLDAPITKDYMEAAKEMWNDPDSTKYSKYADTDKDGLYDFQEIDFISGKIKLVNGELRFPTIKECLNEKSGLFYVDNELNRFFLEDQTELRNVFFNKTCLIPILSDPTVADTDEDGFVDYYEYKCHERRNTSASDTSINYLNGLRFDEWQAKSDMARLVKIAGFTYEPQQKIIKSTQYPIQRFFGFSRAIDKAADDILSSAIYCDPICFYYGGNEYMLELWKGQYGIMSGAEVGLYYRNPYALEYTISLADIVGVIADFVHKYEDEMDDYSDIINQVVYDLSNDSMIMSALEYFDVDLYELACKSVDFVYDVIKVAEFFGVKTDFKFTYYDDDSCIYNPDNYYDEKWYRTVAPEDMIDVSYTFDTVGSGNSDQVSFTRDDIHWWTTGFEWGKYIDSEENVSVIIKIDFKNSSMKEAFISGGRFPNYTHETSESEMYEYQKLGLNSLIDNSKNENDGVKRRTDLEATDTEVVLEYLKYGFNAQPQTVDDKSYIQGNNTELIKVYKKAKEFAGISYDDSSNNKLEKLLYTNDPNMITVDNFMDAFDDTDFFTSFGHCAWLLHAGLNNTNGVLDDWQNDTHNSLLSNLADNAVSWSYGLQFYGTYFNILNSASDAISNLGINANVFQLLYWAALPGMNLDELASYAKTLANSKYTDGRTTKYLYEFYEEWYHDYETEFSIDKDYSDYDSIYEMQLYYNMSHFPGMVYSTNFLLQKVLNIQIAD